MGQIITFYSYKGGVGRTMALANIAVLLAQWRYKILIADWDLEAPGLEYFFKDYLNLEAVTQQKGIIDLLNHVSNNESEQHPKWRDCLINVSLPDIKEGTLQLITAGKRDEMYFNKVRNLDVNTFYIEKNGGIFVENLRNEWKEAYDFVLIDSRTGITDYGGICTIQLPDILALLFTAMEQSLKGIIELTKKAFTARQKLPVDRLRLVSIPIPSKFDTQKEFEISQEWLNRFASELKGLYADWLPRSFKRRDILEITKIPYVPYFSFGEKLAVLEQGTNDPVGLGYAYETLAAMLANNLEYLELLKDDRDLYIWKASKKEAEGKSGIFISYSHKDEVWKDRLVSHLGVLQQEVFLDVWDDRRIGAGEDWYQKIKETLIRARVAVLLVSADFLTSKFIRSEEIPSLLERMDREELRIYPVILKPCAWKHVKWFARMNLRPKDGKPISSGNVHQIDADLATIADEVAAIIESKTPKTLLETSSIDPQKIPQEYKDWVREYYSTISYDQLAKKGEVLPVQLLEVYIPLETANPFHKAEMLRMSKARGEESRLVLKDELEGEADLKEPATIDLEALLGREDCILLRGKAGMGKTTLIKHLANTITGGSCQSSLRDYLPVMVFLKDFWLVYREEMTKSRGKISFEPLLKAYLEKIKCPLNLAVISYFLQHNRALFMFDGLDEIPEGIRDDLVELIADFQFENKGNRFLITGRPHGIAGRPHERFGKYLCEIEYLDDQRINEFIRKWFRAVSGKATGLADTTAEDMISDIVFHEHVSVFTQNPLLLAAVCVLYLAGGRIPEQRADLYDRIVENLLWRRFHDPAEPEKVDEVREFLMLLAFEMQNKNLKTFEVGDGLDVLKRISIKKDNEQANEYQRRIKHLFDEIEPNCGLFNRLSGGEIEFTHLTFQEFMAAKQIVYMDLDYNEFLVNDWWAETILLYTGLLSLEMRKRSNNVVDAILNTKQEDEKIKRRLWLLGSRALRDFQPSIRDDHVVALARKKLYDLIDSNASLEERFEAGEIVGVLGDLRIKVDNLDMVLVKEGKFMRGSSEDDAFSREKPQREIYLDDFMIGKYPVTNEEFKEFVDDGGYKRKEFWTLEGWQWREENEIYEPEYLHDRKWNAKNFPVVGISWFEAEAYANWLSKRTGHRYRLPTEAEWEKAARGTNGFKYPWGEHFDNNLCNSFESGLFRTSPVGIFPKDKSPYGCFDMAGNVWEWCSDWYGADYYVNSSDRNPKGPSDGANRVVRGGSWYARAGGCRSAYRSYGDPRDRADNLGFRFLQEL
ncbi:Formylglycine-generating enzyme [Methanophagales archaeon]|nr:Formylglycine-generating enzyme [Methanophagales archaeon]